MTSKRAFMFHNCISRGKTFFVVPTSRSPVKGKGQTLMPNFTKIDKIGHKFLFGN